MPRAPHRRYSTKTKHPCAGMSARAYTVFEAMATGLNNPYATWPLLRALLARDLIEQTGMKTVSRDVLGDIEVPEYEVTRWAHIQWCQWCSENVKDDA